MPSPPLSSPVPRRWRGDGPEERFAALLAPEAHDDHSGSGWVSARETPSESLEDTSGSEAYGTAPDTAPTTPAPIIRTISPSPQRNDAGSPTRSVRSTRSGGSSPLPLPNRSEIFGEPQGRSSGSFLYPRSTQQERGSSGLRPNSPPRQSQLGRSDSLRPVSAQQTGQSTTTLDLAYDGVLASLNVLAGGPTTQQNTNSFNPNYTRLPNPPVRPIESSNTPRTPIRYGNEGYFPLGSLEAVSERTEPGSTTTSIHGSPMPPPRGLPEHARIASHDSQRTQTGTMDTASVASIAQRFPLPPSPVKGPRIAAPQTSPKKASDLIRLFESRATVPETVSKTTAMALGSPFHTPQPSSQDVSKRFESIFAQPSQRTPPSSFRTPFSDISSKVPLGEPIPPTPPPKSPSPISNIRTLIASWRQRTGSPSQRVVGSPGKGDGPRLFGRDKGWNVSIRRRRRQEGREGKTLAEQTEDRPEIQYLSHQFSPPQQFFTPPPGSTGESGDVEGGGGGEQGQHGRTPSIRSQAISERDPSQPKMLTGEPIRTGALYYLNVHDPDTAPDYRWIQADARLFPEGLQLTWRTPEGSQAMVTLDLEYCEEVASTYSPNNPQAGDDIGAMAARRQGELAENLYPFKLVYDDGTERLACDSARDRVRWVNAIWTVLERTRTVATGGQSGSIRSAPHLGSGSDGGGSASTHVQHVPSPHPGFTSDDAIITTSGGLAAPLVQRGSRRLAVGPQRGRSLRRVASEADLSESSGPPEALPSPSSTGLGPLTAEAARGRERPASRDFTFARGIPPPPRDSSSFGLGSPRSQISQETRTYHTPGAPSTSRTMGTATQGPPSEMHTAIPPPTSAGTVGYPESSIGMQTAQPYAESVSTVRGPQTNLETPSQGIFSPTFARFSSQTFGTVPPPSTGMHTAQQPTESPYGSFATAPSPWQSAVPPPTTAHTAVPPSTTAHTAQEGEFQTPQWTAREPSESPYTAYQTGSVPLVAVTHATPSDQTSQGRSFGTAPRNLSTALNTAPSQAYDTTSLLSGQYGTTTAGALGSPFHTPQQPPRDSIISTASYTTAAPPPPSKDSEYTTASEGASIQRYSLHDPPVPNPAQAPSAAYLTGEDDPSSYTSAPAPPTYMSTAQTGEVPSYHTASDPRAIQASTHVVTAPSATRETWVSAIDTMYTTAQEGTRTSSRRDSLSARSDLQEMAETGTHISEPDSDDEAIKDLERQSSSGSFTFRPKPPTYSKSRSHATPQTGSGKMPFGLANENTGYGTPTANTSYNEAKESAYATVPSWQTLSTFMGSAPTPSLPYNSARSGLTVPIVHPEHSTHPVPPSSSNRQPIRGPSKPPSSISTARSEPTSSRSGGGGPPPPPGPSPPPPGDGSGSGTPTGSTFTSTAYSSRRGNPDLNRLLNYLQGQDTARQGLTSQLDRIEGKVWQIADTLPRLEGHKRAVPPPVPSKDDRSPPLSPSSTTSDVSTARPVTPPPLLLPPNLTDQLADMRSLLGTVIGQNNSLLQEMDRRRSFNVELPPQNPSLRRLEDLLRRALVHLGDSDIMEEMGRTPRQPNDIPMEYDEHGQLVPSEKAYSEGGIYEGGGSIYSDEFNPKVRAPVNSMTSEYDRQRRGGFSPIPDSLLEGSVGEPDFDDEFAVQNLPPSQPPSPHIPEPISMPQALSRIRRKPVPQAVPAPIQEEEYEDIPYHDHEPEPEQPLESPLPTPASQITQPLPQTPQDQTPAPLDRPLPQEPEEEYYDEEEPDRGPYRPGPPPQPVDLPTPVRSPRDFTPLPPPHPGPSMRPWPAAPMPPMGPGIAEMPRPSLPRLAGVRDPISTTYFRRGFPPPGPMGGPFGMFPGPLGMPGPGMGPFMPGLRPGLTGFGGPIGPNVAPHLRRPGIFPPGVTATTGDYGLPAAAHYPNRPSGPTIPGRPPVLPDQGISGSTSSESGASPPTTQLVTPYLPEKPLQEPTIVKPHQQTSVPVTPVTDDGFRRAFDNAETLAHAQGEQQNEMSRYLHGVSDQLADTHNATKRDLANILADIGRLRDELKPRHVLGHVLPDGRVVLSNGDVVDGIRGAPIQPIPGAPPPPPPTQSHVQGTILPDGTVMVGDMVVDGIRGAAPTPVQPGDLATVQELRNLEQDRRLADLQDKIADLMHRSQPTPGAEASVYADEIASTRAVESTPRPLPTNHVPTLGPSADTDIRREKHVFREHETIHDRPGHHHKEVDIDEVHDVQREGTAAVMSAHSSIVSENEVHHGHHVPHHTTTSAVDVAPTGAGVPTASRQGVSLTPRPMSLIATEAGDVPGQLIREEHEEIIQRPGGGPPIVTHTTTRTYQPGPPGSRGATVNRPATAYADQPATTYGDPPTGTPTQHFQDEEFVQADAPNASIQRDEQEALSTGPPLRPLSNVHTGASQGGGRRGTTVADPAQMWDTNHARPATTVANVPSRKAHSVAAQPDYNDADAPNDPTGGGGGGDGIAPGAATVEGDGSVGQPQEQAADAGDGNGNGNGKRGVHWLPHIPVHEVRNVPSRPPSANGRKNGKKETNIVLPPGESGDPTQGAGPGGLPQTTEGDAGDPGDGTTGAPGGSGQSGVDGTAADAATPGHHMLGGHQTGSTEQPMYDTNHANPNRGNEQGGGGLLQKLRPAKSKESLRGSRPASTTQQDAPNASGGPPLTDEIARDAAGNPARVPPNGKDTRFSDTAFTQQLPEDHSGLVEPQFESTAQRPASTASSTKNRLRKPPPADFTEGDIGGGANAGAGADPRFTGETTSLGGAGGSQDSTRLKKMTLPDGRTAYVEEEITPSVSEKGGKRGKGKGQELENVGTDGTGRGGHMPGGHCSVCCPNGPPAGVVQPCEHQPGTTGPPIPQADRPASLAPSAVLQKKKKSPPTAGPLGLPGEGMSQTGGPDGIEGDLAGENNNIAVDGAPNGNGKLRKGKGSMPPPAEEQLDEARRLAQRQKAAAEQAAAEAAERERIDKEKAELARIAEERHKQNVETLLNLQKALDSMANDNKTWRSLQDGKVKDKDKRRSDKTTRDKKLQEALDKLVVEANEMKKRNTADEKKPGTQAILDALKVAGDSQAGFLRKLAVEINEQNSNQHSQTQAAMKAAAREQVGFNLAG
ncbi:hypothetical protein M231_02077 [Tremella mesenterica]|uniref:PH domain-containing protein n=1 Tax=Tremella mesenterica TaxID=5217 RepID=A0A4Q1BRT1_TREME|nr:hypothetical protein M231_02077 [Tremella mesenterica]